MVKPRVMKVSKKKKAPYLCLGITLGQVHLKIYTLNELPQVTRYVVAKTSGFECFDSLGISEEVLEKRLPKANFKNCVFNETALQPQDSKNCGLYCQYFVTARFLNLDLP